MTFVSVVLSGHALRRARFDRARQPKPSVVDLETSRKLDPEAVKADAKHAVDAARKLFATEPEEEPAKPSLLSRAHPLRKHGFPGASKSAPSPPDASSADVEEAAPVAAAGSPSDDANGAKKALKNTRFA